MYPVLIRRLADLRSGDRIITRSGIRYPLPLRVATPLGTLPGSSGRGVRVENPTTAGPAAWVLYPWQMDGQVLEVDRPTSRCPDDAHHWTETRRGSAEGYRSWVCTVCPQRCTTVGDEPDGAHR